MSEAVQLMPVRGTLAGRWQVPCLVAGIGLFGVGIWRIVDSYRPLTLERERAIVARLQATGHPDRAVEFLSRRLNDPERDPVERAELHRLLAATIHQMESALSSHAAANAEAIISNVQSAVRLGGVLGREDWTRLGDAYGWAGDLAEAEDAFRQALRESPRRPDDIRRKIAELHGGVGEALSPAALADLDAILASEDSSSDNYLWALERKAQWLADRGEFDAAQAIVKEAEARLAGTAEGLAATYIEALCLARPAESPPDDEARRESGQAAAQALLRSLLNEWTVRDELWAKASWLLGTLELKDGRPQSALSFFEEVLRLFDAGDVRDACLAGRAECLAALERHDTALATFAELRDRLSTRDRHRFVDRDAVRALLTVLGESMLRGGREPSDAGQFDRVNAALRYLRLSADLTDPADAELVIWHRNRIADGLAALAAAAERPSTDAAVARRAEELHAEAAAAYQALSRDAVLDDRIASDAAWSASIHLERAGRREAMIESLARFASEWPLDVRRSEALYRLGRVHAEAGRFRQAAAAFEENVETYETLPFALRSIVPWAQCLFALGGDDARRGERLLVDVVDDRNPRTVVTPRALEYRDALFCLAEHYFRVTVAEAPDHWERAIERLEDAVSLFPQDARAAEMKFLLAEAYRQSATAVLKESQTLTGDLRQRSEDAAKARFDQALVRYTEVIADLAGDDSALSEAERGYLRTSYLYRGDCLFDQERIEEALAAYQEAAWRYDDHPAAVPTTLQIVRCHELLGRPDAARAALGRLRWLLSTIPDAAFAQEPGMPSKAEWQTALDRSARIRLAVGAG